MYKLDELGMNISIPSNMIVFTQNIPKDDPNIELYGLDRDALIEQYKNGNIYLNAISEDTTYEIVITKATNDGLKELSDMNTLSNEELSSFLKELKTLYKSNGITYQKSNFHQHTQVKFIKIFFERSGQENDTVYSIQYYTVINGNAVNITLHSYNNPISSSMEELLSQIVDSAEFDIKVITIPTITPRANLVEFPETKSSYTDNEVGVTFTVPAGWREMELMKERKHIKTKYGDKDGNILLFGYTDGWSSMPESDKQGLKRSDLNNDSLTKSELLELYGTDNVNETTVEYVTINNIEYFRVTRQFKYEVSETEVNRTMVSHLILNNGILFEFSFVRAIDSTAYKQYDELLSSIKYENLSTYSSPVNSTKKMFNLPINSSDKSLVLAMVLSIIYTITVYALPIIVYRYLIRKAPVPPKKAKAITIIYGIIAFIAVIYVGTLVNDPSPGGAVLFWSFVNYRILTGGVAKKTLNSNSSEIYQSKYDEEDSTDQFSNDIEDELIKKDSDFCNSCGAPLPPDSLFCNKCGEQIRG